MYGKQDFNHSETVTGPGQENVRNALNIKTVGEAECISGMERRRMY